MESDFERARSLIAQARSVAALTGAGVSAESGIPTFRGADGLWENYKAEELATPEAFASDPELIWRWYDWRRGLIGTAKPNQAHVALARMEEMFENFHLITQNVDGLHRLAGSTDPIELHGNIWRVRCLLDGSIEENRQIPLDPLPPRCGRCQALARPHIVWFGESLEPSVLRGAHEAARSADLFFVIGTSGLVEPAAGFASLAKSNSAKVIEINLEPTPISKIADISLLGPAGEIMPRLIKNFATRKGIRP